MPETINRIRLSDQKVILLDKVLQKIDDKKLNINEKKFYEILTKRIQGRLELKKKR